MAKPSPRRPARPARQKPAKAAPAKAAPAKGKSAGSASAKAKPGAASAKVPSTAPGASAKAAASAKPAAQPPANPAAQSTARTAPRGAMPTAKGTAAASGSASLRAARAGGAGQGGATSAAGNGSRLNLWKLPPERLQPLVPRVQWVLAPLRPVSEAHVVGVRKGNDDLPTPVLVVVIDPRAPEQAVLRRLLQRLKPVLPRGAALDLSPVQPDDPWLADVRKAGGEVFRRPPGTIRPAP